jgi:hypothetical protein
MGSCWGIIIVLFVVVIIVTVLVTAPAPAIVIVIIILIIAFRSQFGSRLSGSRLCQEPHRWMRPTIGTRSYVRSSSWAINLPLPSPDGLIAPLPAATFLDASICAALDKALSQKALSQIGYGKQ